MHVSQMLKQHGSCAVSAGGKRRASPGADPGRCHAEGSKGASHLACPLKIPLTVFLQHLGSCLCSSAAEVVCSSWSSVLQDALSARNDLLERLLAMQEQQAQQNTNSIVETEEVSASTWVSDKRMLR